MAMPSSEVENSTYYSSRRRRKSTRGLMGMRTREYLVKGNDPFDYEQKFSEDQRYEELGPAARVWRTYLEECVAFDIEMVEGWRDGLDVLLVFAGLFSAVVTTFVTQTSQSLQVNYSQVTASLLFELIDVTRAAANGSLVNNIPRSDLTPFSSFRPTTSDTWVNGLWFTSLSFSLATALFAVLTKQWIHQYIGASSGTPRERCHIRQFRYMGLQQWGVGLIIGLLPVLLSVSLGVFLVGLVIFLIPLQVSIASVVGAISFMSFAAYFVTNLLPIWYSSCSYKTPLSQYAFLLYMYITCHPFFASAISRFCVPPPSVQTDEPQDEPPESSSIRTLRDAERAVVEINADEMDVHALAWLFNMSTNPSVQSIVVQSTSALPLSSVEPLKQHAKGISDMCETFIWNMGPWQERIVDRLARASLRLVMDGEQSGPAWTFPDAEAGRERWSQDVYAEALAVVACPGYPECIPTIRHLVETQFRPSEDKRLLLQPIVWGHLLRRLITSDPEDTLIQPLFHAIPSRYWHADYIPPPLFLAKNGLKICLPSDLRDGAESLLSVIESYLYPYVAGAIYQRFRDAADITFHPYPTNEFPAPPGPRLRMLLTMAASHSVQRVTITDPSIDSLFIMIIRHIGVYVGVDSLRLHDGPALGGNTPSFELDCNRHAVLKVLYMMVSSDKFGDTAWMRSKDQRVALMLFLQILKSTFRRPRFISEDWCTPAMASNFVWIAFQDDPLTSQHDNSLSYGASPELQLVLYFLQFPHVINETFAYIISERLLDRIISSRGVATRLVLRRIVQSRIPLQTVLSAFITGLESDTLDREIFHWARAYLFQLANLLTVWVIYVLCDDTYNLRRLALLRRDDLDPTWTEHLKDLDTIGTYYELQTFKENHARTISDFRAFVDGDCMGDYGLSSEPGPTVTRKVLPLENLALDEDQPRVGSLRNLWQRLRRHPDIGSQKKVSV